MEESKIINNDNLKDNTPILLNEIIIDLNNDLSIIIDLKSEIINEISKEKNVDQMLVNM